MPCSTPAKFIPDSKARRERTPPSKRTSTRCVNTSFAEPKSPPTPRPPTTKDKKRKPATFFTRALHRNQTRPFENQTTSDENQTTLHENQTTLHENQTTLHENQTTLHENQTTLNENQRSVSEKSASLK